MNDTSCDDGVPPFYWLVSTTTATTNRTQRQVPPKAMPLLHAAEYDHIVNQLGAEVLTLAVDPATGTAVDDDDVGGVAAEWCDDAAASGSWRRLHEVLSCVCISLSSPIVENSVLVVPLSSSRGNSSCDGVVQCALSAVFKDALPVSPSRSSDESGFHLLRHVSTKYYSADVAFYPTGLGWSIASDAEGSTVGQHPRAYASSLRLSQYHVVLLVSGAAQCEDVGADMQRYRTLWSGAMANFMSSGGDDDDDTAIVNEQRHCANAAGVEENRAAAIWLTALIRGRDDNDTALDAAIGEPGIEVIEDAPPLSSSRDELGSGGVVRVQELLECTQWPLMTKVVAPTATTETAAPRDVPVGATPSVIGEESANDAKTPLEAPASATVTTSTAADDGDVMAGLVWSGCELPRHMFVDPTSLRTVVVVPLLPKSSSPSSSSMLLAKYDNITGDSLISWMHTLKSNGHKLRRTDRQRQALILAEALAEEEDAEGADGE